MKKLIALLSVLTVALGAFTACGSEETESSTDLSSVISESVADNSSESSVAETSEADTTEAETTTETEKVTKATKTKTTTTKSEKTTATKSADSEADKNSGADMSFAGDGAGENTEIEIENADKYISAVERLYTAFASNDINTAMSATFPKTVLDAMNESGMTNMFSDQFGETDLMAGEGTPDFNQIKVIAVREADSDEIELAASYYSQIEGLCKAMNEAGVTYDMLMNNEVTEEQMIKLNDSGYLNANEDMEIIVDFEEYYYVTYSMNGEEIEMPVFKQSGDDIKIDITVLGLINSPQ